MQIVTKTERVIKEDQIKVVCSWLEDLVAGKRELRESYRMKGFVVPNIVLFEITNQCNRRCVNCALPFDSNKTISLDIMVDVIEYFKERGTYGVGISGGEPFLPSAREILFKAVTVHSDIMFWVYTNGDLIGSSYEFVGRKFI
jgi:MoaA/NifB/PqqE/SkfB family radical SAM enzyme